ncbi:MAG TPA: DUF4430 domain-containing protein [Candidatus Nanoarchaeia archaeon]|nr:DUF4430 domain-containing protein [Candidatus Nanoarchaeia archaeon]
MAVSIALSGCKEQPASGEATLVIDSLGSVKTERFKFSYGTPLGLLKYNHSVDTLFEGSFIECIDGICADGKYLWLLYVNNKTINYGAKKYRLADGDIVKFQFSNKHIGGKR